MDLIGALSSQLGISDTQAKAVAGGVMGLVKGNLEESDEDGTSEAARKLQAAVPEMSEWQQAAAALDEEEEPASSGGLGGMLGGLMGGGKGSGGGGGMGSMLGALSSGSGGGALGALAGAVGGADARNTAMLVGILGKVGLDSSKAQMVAPIAYGFLKERLGPETMAKVNTAAPFLTKFL